MNNMAEFFYNLLNAQAFWVVLAVCFFICIAWVERWRPLLERLGKLVVKPVIFKKDSEPNNVPFYPRSLIEDSANGFRDTLRKPFADVIVVVSNWFTKLASLIYSKDHPFRTLGFLLLLGCFSFFVLADAIAVANTLVVLNLWAGTLPDLLGRFDFAVFGGSLLALIIGLALVFEMRSDRSEFTPWSERDAQTKALALGIALLVTLLSFLTLIAWALFRLIELGRLESNPFLDGLLNWVLFGLVPINSALAAAITFFEAMRGVLVLFLLIGWILIGLLYLLDYGVTILGTLVPFIFDLVYRVIYIVFDILQWFISTPIHAVLLPFRLIATIFVGSRTEANKPEGKP
ncbi:MAG: hypothetical protein HYZ25_05790 [Chloroflexi bacterium]|nr:hypothetical protein [Chloroflexota bacterium]